MFDLDSSWEKLLVRITVNVLTALKQMTRSTYLVEMTLVLQTLEMTQSTAEMVTTQFMQDIRELTQLVMMEKTPFMVKVGMTLSTVEQGTTNSMAAKVTIT